ncbi:MAG: proline dehydrogenase family protein [Geodermatophilaceae bacterium]
MSGSSRPPPAEPGQSSARHPPDDDQTQDTQHAGSHSQRAPPVAGHLPQPVLHLSRGFPGQRRASDDQRAEHLAVIAAALPPGRRIQVGAEDLGRADAVLGCVLTVAENGLADRLGATVQANLRRASADLERLVGAGVHIRLVKGAYVEPPSRALPYGEPTDVAYLTLAHRLAETGAEFALATHDGVVREALLAALGPRPVEQLLGLRPEVLDDLVERGVPVRVYLPFGHDWFRYWMRRVAESRGKT